MNPLARPVLLAAAVAILATVAVWLSVMPDAPEDALEDGLIASASASLECADE